MFTRCWMSSTPLWTNPTSTNSWRSTILRETLTPLLETLDVTVSTKCWVIFPWLVSSDFILFLEIIIKLSRFWRTLNWTRKVYTVEYQDARSPHTIMSGKSQHFWPSFFCLKFKTSLIQLKFKISFLPQFSLVNSGRNKYLNFFYPTETIF